jgi:peptidoglycan/LPS O-acetylase OafA/YrhL
LFVAVAVGWIMTTLIEVPLTAYGRSWKWSSRRTEISASLAEAAPLRQ